MENDELSFVSPSRRKEVRRRLNAVRRYLANPVVQELEQSCLDLGMQRSQFFLMVQVFSRTNDPGSLPGAFAEKKYDLRIGPDFRRFFDRVIAANPTADEKKVLQLIDAEAALRGLSFHLRQQ